MGSYQLGVYQAKFSQGSAADPGFINTQASGPLSVDDNEFPRVSSKGQCYMPL